MERCSFEWSMCFKTVRGTLEEKGGGHLFSPVIVRMFHRAYVCVSTFLFLNAMDISTSHFQQLSGD